MATGITSRAPIIGTWDSRGRPGIAARSIAARRPVLGPAKILAAGVGMVEDAANIINIDCPIRAVVTVHAEQRERK